MSLLTLPSLFIGHGAPDLPLSDHPAKQFLQNLSATLPTPQSILIISAHWQAPVLSITTAPQPKTLHDFGGFPAALDELQYPARTDAQLIQQTTQLLSKAGMALSESGRGYDHGAWVPLLLTYPLADIPVVQLSLKQGGNAKTHFEIGKILAPLRKQNVLIIGSGASVHNLHQLAPDGSEPPGWAVSFDEWLAHNLITRDMNTLLEFPEQPANARQAHPSDEHLLPIFVAMGAAWEGGSFKRLHHSYSYGSVGMAAYAFGAHNEKCLTTNLSNGQHTN